MKLALMLAVLALFFFSGCAQQTETAMMETQNARFELPDQKQAYHAVYNVEEGATMKKEVWRSGRDMRADLSVKGMKALSFYFSGGKAHSCSFIVQPISCYDITASLSQADADRLAPRESDFAGAEKVESVKIGDTTGNCYETFVPGLGARKACFAVGGVVAYDSYNVANGVAHVEYLTSLEIYPQGLGPDDSVFALPAKPAFAPARAENAETVLPY